MTAQGRAPVQERPRSGPAQVWWRAALVIVVVLQLLVLYAPSEPSVGGLSGVPGLDKAVHASVFALVMLAGRAGGLPRPWVVMLTVVQAPLSEIVQATLLPHRDGDPWDVVADLAGCLLGWWLTRERS